VLVVVLVTVVGPAAKRWTHLINPHHLGAIVLWRCSPCYHRKRQRLSARDPDRGNPPRGPVIVAWQAPATAESP